MVSKFKMTANFLKIDFFQSNTKIFISYIVLFSLFFRISSTYPALSMDEEKVLLKIMNRENFTHSGSQRTNSFHQWYHTVVSNALPDPNLSPATTPSNHLRFSRHSQEHVASTNNEQISESEIANHRSPTVSLNPV